MADSPLRTVTAVEKLYSNNSPSSSASVVGARELGAAVAGRGHDRTQGPGHLHGQLAGRGAGASFSRGVFLHALLPPGLPPITPP